jgi:hypothetical protein
MRFNDPKSRAVPTNAGVDYKYIPASGYLDPYPTRESSLAGCTENRIALQTFGLNPSPWSSIQKVPRLVLDEFSLGCYKQRYILRRSRMIRPFGGRHVRARKRVCLNVSRSQGLFRQPKLANSSTLTHQLSDYARD